MGPHCINSALVHALVHALVQRCCIKRVYAAQTHEEKKKKRAQSINIFTMSEASSILSIPDVVDSTIRSALKKSTGGGGGGGLTGGIFQFAKQHTFTLLGVIAVALVIAVGVYMAVRYYNRPSTALNTDEEALLMHNFVEDSDDDEEPPRRQRKKKEKSVAIESEEAEELPVSSGDPEEPVDDPNWTSLEELAAPRE